MIVIFKLFKFNKKKPRFKLLLICSFIVFILGLFLGFKSSYNFTNMISNLKIDKTATIITEESLLNEVKSVNKLIPLEIELTQSILIDKSYWDLDVFKKCKTITFFANCSYSVDFSTLNSKDILLDNENKNITIYIPKPEIFSININEDKTHYSEPELGLLRFGDIQLSSEEFGNLRLQLHEAFKEKMLNDTELKTQAVTNTKQSLESLIFNLIGENYNINVKVKGA